MFDLIKTVLKWSLVTAVVLVIGHWVEWKGSSLSQHAKGVSDVIKTEASSAREWVKDQEIPEKVEEKAEEFLERVNQGVPSEASAPIQKAKPDTGTDSIEASEREKLRSLIRDLNR
jgi:hypothetical protein